MDLASGQPAKAGSAVKKPRCFSSLNTLNTPFGNCQLEIYAPGAHIKI